MKRVECSSCETMFKSRFGRAGDGEDIGCPTCRAGDRRREPPETGCPVAGCDREPLADREIRSLAGSSFDARVCVSEAGSLIVHRDSDSGEE